jgi:VWFA-related protein
MLLPVSVLDESGVPVQELSSEDFVVIEDGVEQEVAVVLRPSDAPLDIALLMDVSDRMENFHYMEGRVRSSIADFLDQLSEDDCVLLLRYRESLRLGLWGRPRDPALRAAIDEPPMEGGTALRDAIAEGLHRLELDLERCGPASFPAANDRSVMRRRRAMVVVADGRDGHSFRPFADLLSLARQSEAPILSVGLDDVSLPQPLIRKALADEALFGSLFGREIGTHVASLSASPSAARTVTFLKALATATGGHFIRGGESLGRLGSVFTEALRWLRSYYLVGYYLNRPEPIQGEYGLPTWHDIEVRLNRPGYRAEARAGYFHTPIDEIAASYRIEAALELIARGSIEGAMTELATALQADPYSWEAHYQRGRVLLRGGDTVASQQSLLAAAELSPGQGDVHELACRVSLQLEDYPTAWEQAIRAQQAEVDVSEELLLLRKKPAEPADLEERLNAPSIFVDFYGSIHPVEDAAMRSVSLALTQQLAEAPEIGLIDLEALADYRLMVRMKEISFSSPRQLEIDLEVWESEGAGGDRIYQRPVAFSNIEKRREVEAELEPIITELLEWLCEHLRG